MVLALSTVNRVDEIIARAQHDGRAPALVVGVVRDGTLAYVTGAGDVAVAERDVQFRIGSISKSFTAALVLSLRDDGGLRLDDPVATYLPELTGPVGTVPLYRLLAHAGGLRREPVGPWWERHPGQPLAELLAGVSAETLSGLPPGQFHYSNLAYGLLGGVVERVVGEPWREALQRRLLDPLGLQRTSYEPQEPYARGYVVHPWHGTLREEPRADALAMAPAGQLWSTVEDLARWAAVLASAPPGGGHSAGTVVSPAIVAEMATPAVIADPDQWSFGYGLGLHLWRRHERVYCGHTGSMPGYLAVVCVHRPTRTAAVAFANTYSLPGTTIGDLGAAIVDAVLDHEPAAPPALWRPNPDLPAHLLPLCGRWWWMGTEFEASWDAASGHLVICGLWTDYDGDEWRFRPAGEDRWLGLTGANAGEVLTLHRGPAGEVTALEIATFVFKREPMRD